MTTTETAPSTAEMRPLDGRRKNVLFCPSCGHESPMDGDWLVDWTRNARLFRCPDCRTVINERLDDVRSATNP